MFACSIHFHGGWLWKSTVKRRKSVLILLIEIERVRGFSQEVTLERVCRSCMWKCENVKRARVLENEESIVNTCHWVGSKNAGRNCSGGRSFEHWPRGSPGQWVPETDCFRASAIFVSVTSGITPILNNWSVSPTEPFTFVHLG